VKNLIYLLISVCLLVGCAAGPSISYRMITNTDPFSTLNITTYDIRLDNTIDQNVVVEKKMLKIIDDNLKLNGWVKSNANPDYYITVNFSISDGIQTTKTGSVPVTTKKDGVSTTTQQHYSKTSTSYEREINIFLYSKDDELVWQGDLISNGSIQDVMYLAPHIIPHAIRNMGLMDISEKFRHNCNKSVCPEHIR